MQTYFNIRFEFDKGKVHAKIAECLKEYGCDYICVADGVIMNIANRKPDYLKVVNGGMFSICDSSYVPIYIRCIYGKHYEQYCGSQIFEDIVKSRKYRMIFLGTQQPILDTLKVNLTKINQDVEDMKFVELPFCAVDDFDYPAIARMIKDDGSDIIWIALGAPKQEYFMSKLKPYLDHGVMIAVGAAFKFFSDVDSNRAPLWMVRNHLEFVHRVFSEPRKQLKRCGWIILTLPKLLFEEIVKKHKNKRKLPVEEARN